MQITIMNVFKLNFFKLGFLIVLFELISGAIHANAGDTTWITIYNLRKLTYYGNYDTTSTLPAGKRYRKIRLHYILSTYPCPAGSQYCGSWDYTTQIFAKPQNNDTVEIARVITPYATDWIQTNRKHDYIIDVTDYASVLQGNLGFRFGYQGYSYGFAITLKLELIEGVPPMDALKVKNIYDGYYAYGKTSDSIEKHLIPKVLSFSNPATNAMIKNTISGHGSDDSNCSEFCSKYYQVKLNNTQIAQNQIWRSDCGLNNVYPQTGTWLYERANWCPGAVVWPFYHDISSLTSANTNFSVDINMQPYTAPNQSNSTAGYNFVSQLISYSAPNHTTDISIEDIISPSIDPNYFRSNPSCTNPTIKIRNVGTNTVTQVVFNYGLKGTVPLTYTWTGSLNYLALTDVVFPLSLQVYTNTSSNIFEVSVVSVNGIIGDQNLFNNIYSSKTNSVSSLINKFAISSYFNNATDPNTSKNETNWKLEDENGNVIASRINNPNSTLYSDTVDLQPGCYKFSITDAGCDGMSWWNYSNYVPNPGNGFIRFNYATFNTPFFTFNGDFGCGLIKYFKVGSTVGLIENNLVVQALELFPNPTSMEAYLKIDLKYPQTLCYRIYDLTGKLLVLKKTAKISLGIETIDTSKLLSGSYIVNIQLEDGTTANKKLIIQK